DLDGHAPLRGPADGVTVTPGGARQDEHDAETDGARDQENHQRALHRERHRAFVSSHRLRITAAATLSMTSRRRARDRSASSSTSSASTVLKLSSIRSTGTSIAWRRRAANASTLAAARPT